MPRLFNKHKKIMQCSQQWKLAGLPHRRDWADASWPVPGSLGTLPWPCEMSRCPGKRQTSRGHAPHSSLRSSGGQRESHSRSAAAASTCNMSANNAHEKATHCNYLLIFFRHQCSISQDESSESRPLTILYLNFVHRYIGSFDNVFSGWGLQSNLSKADHNHPPEFLCCSKLPLSWPWLVLLNLITLKGPSECPYICIERKDSSFKHERT